MMRITGLAALAAGLLFAGCAAPRPTPEPTASQASHAPSPSPSEPPSPAIEPEASPEISIEAGITPRMTPEDVAAVVIDQIHSMERMVGHIVAPPRILSMRATTAEGGIHWQVRAEGTFFSPRPRTSPPPIAASGHFLISDADGTVVGFGFP